MKEFRLDKMEVVKGIMLLANLFIPGAANLVYGHVGCGVVLLLLSQAIFFSIPYLPIILIRNAYLFLLFISYVPFLVIRERGRRGVLLIKSIGIVASSFVILSIFSLNSTYLIKGTNETNPKEKIIYVLGTKPFKIESAQRMLDMSDDELLSLFNNDTHPFFRRLKLGIKKSMEDGNHALIISASGNQKKITQKILQIVSKNGVFLSCKSTKEEIQAIRDYVNDNDEALGGLSIVIVSDSYHAFRVLMYSKLYNLQSVGFLATGEEHFIGGSVKRYLTEQFLFLLSYFNLPVNLLKSAIYDIPTL